LGEALAAFEAETAFRFRHGLLRDAAYEATAKRLRARWHAAFGDWLQARVGARLPEYEEIVGYHFEQAHRYLTELGPLDEQGRTFAARGAARLRSAGGRAAGRGDARAASNLLLRAAALLADNDHERAETLIEASEALMLAGDFQQAAWAADEVEAAAQGLDDDRLLHRARLERVWRALQVDGPAWSTAHGARTVDEAIAVLTTQGDHRGLARAWRVKAMVGPGAHRGAVAAEACAVSALHAARADDRAQEIDALSMMLVSSALGPDTPEVYGRRRGEAMRRADEGGELLASMNATDALLAAMAGRFDEARQLYRRATAILADLGQAIPLANIHVFFAYYVEALAGDWAGAEAQVRAGYEIVERLGERTVLSCAAGRLARALEELARWDEVERYVAIADGAAWIDDYDAHASLRAADALLHAHRGDAAVAVARAAEAVAAADTADDLNLLGWTLETQARVLEMAGRPDAASPALERALDVYRRKGNDVAAARAAALHAGP